MRAGSLRYGARAGTSCFMGSPVISFCRAPIERAERVSFISFLNGDALDFRERQCVTGTIIKLRRARAFVRGDSLHGMNTFRHEKSCDASRPVTVEKASTLDRPAKV